MDVSNFVLHPMLKAVQLARKTFRLMQKNSKKKKVQHHSKRSSTFNHDPANFSIIEFKVSNEIDLIGKDIIV